MVSLRVKTQPICEPISLGLLKNHLYLSTSLDDDILTVYLQAAREQIEAWTNRSFIKKTYEMRMAWLPLFDYRQQGYVSGTVPNPGWYNGLWVADSLKIKLYRPNLIPGTSKIVYNDLSGNAQTLLETENDYQVNPYSEPPIILPKSGTFWPWTRYSDPNAVTITYDSQSGDEVAIQAALTTFRNTSPAPNDAAVLAKEIELRQDAVPGWAKLAILMLSAHSFEHREAVTEMKLSECPMGVYNIISAFCVEDFAPTKG